jgi:O-antigen/teichoic acid export membrane protein
LTARPEMGPAQRDGLYPAAHNGRPAHPPTGPGRSAGPPWAIETCPDGGLPAVPLPLPSPTGASGSSLSDAVLMSAARRDGLTLAPRMDAVPGARPPRSHSRQRRGLLSARGDSLYRSGYALIANVGGTTILGVGFWAVAAHLYTRQQVGQASALVAALIVVSSFAQLNLNNTLPRFLPQAGRGAGRFIGYGYAASSAAALVIGVGFVVILPRMSAQWHFLGDSAMLATAFVVAAVAWGIFALQDSALLGLRQPGMVPLENAVYGALKLLMLVGITATLPATGIFIAWVVPLAINVPAVNGLIYWRYLKKWKFATAETTVGRREVIRFTSVDYVGNLLSQIAGNLLPLLVLTALGAAADASFYIAWTITTGLNLVAMSFATSLLVEGSASPDRLSELTRGVLVRTLVVTVTGAAVLGLGARLVLAVYGHEYAAHAAEVLGLLAAGSVFFGLLAIVFSIDRITGRVSRATFTRLVLAVLTLGASWLLLPPMGVDGVGVAWLGANLVVALARLPTIVGAVRRPAGITRPGAAGMPAVSRSRSLAATGANGYRRGSHVGRHRARSNSINRPRKLGDLTHGAGDP